MRTSTRVAGVLAGLTLTLGGTLAAPAALADIPACTNMASQAGATDDVTTA